ncbi:MAG: hypothetical protein HQL75_18590, partial [Magnetococcales bacterium]|nr:hypothetical protein [Magnetococcales bacterium]
MNALAGVGYSEDTDSRIAGEQAARLALAAMDNRPVALALLFSTSRHDPHRLAEGVRGVIG